MAVFLLTGTALFFLGLDHQGTVLCVSHKTLGVGSSGCGPRPLEPYKVYAKPTAFSYQIQFSKKKVLP